MAFVCWNRFLDIIEATTENRKSSLTNNSDFTDTDIPADFAWPTKSIDVHTELKIEQKN
jgi:hypothetical protein